MLSLSQKRRQLLTDSSRSSSSSPDDAKRSIFRQPPPPPMQNKEKRVNRLRRLFATFNSFDTADTDDSLETNKVPPLMCFDEEEYFVSFPRALMAASSLEDDEDDACFINARAAMDEKVVYPEVFIGEGGKILFEI